MFKSSGTATLGLLVLLTACTKKKEEEAPKPAAEPREAPAEVVESAAALRTKASAMFGVLPKVMESKNHPLSDAKISLGRMLYFDTRLSKSQELSCNSCHDLDAFGVDSRPEAIARGTSFGHKKAFGERNSPTVYNAALQFAQFWDGRAADVEEQAKGPILNPVEMSMAGEENVLTVIKSVPGYAPLFKEAFPDDKGKITYDNIAAAIGAFERTLVTPSPFDKFLEGDDNALSDAQKKGLSTFIATGCIACHNGVGIGGGSYQKLGLVKPYETKDEGRFKVTGNPADKFVFKVPSLRNVAKTGPYFHDGSIKSLPEAVKLMALHQTAAGELPDDKVESIVAFLGALTGEPPTHKIQKPELPPNGPKTPKPDLN